MSFLNFGDGAWKNCRRFLYRGLQFMLSGVGLQKKGAYLDGLASKVPD